MAQHDMSCRDIIDETSLEKVCPAGQGRGFGARCRLQLARVPPNRPEIVDQDLTVDDGGPHIRAAAGVDDGRVRIASARLNEDEIGALADVDAADVVLESECAGAFARGHPY